MDTAGSDGQPDSGQRDRTIADSTGLYEGHALFPGEVHGEQPPQSNSLSPVHRSSGSASSSYSPSDDSDGAESESEEESKTARNSRRRRRKLPKWSLQEEETLVRLHIQLGNKWAAIHQQLPSRKANDIKNIWNSTKRSHKLPGRHVLRAYVRDLKGESKTPIERQQAYIRAVLQVRKGADADSAAGPQEQAPAQAPTAQAQGQASTRTGAAVTATRGRQGSRASAVKRQRHLSTPSESGDEGADENAGQGAAAAGGELPGPSGSARFAARKLPAARGNRRSAAPRRSPQHQERHTQREAGPGTLHDLDRDLQRQQQQQQRDAAAAAAGWHDASPLLSPAVGCQSPGGPGARVGASSLPFQGPMDILGASAGAATFSGQREAGCEAAQQALQLWTSDTAGPAPRQALANQDATAAPLTLEPHMRPAGPPAPMPLAIGPIRTRVPGDAGDGGYGASWQPSSQLPPPPAPGTATSAAAAAAAAGPARLLGGGEPRGEMEAWVNQMDRGGVASMLPGSGAEPGRGPAPMEVDPDGGSDMVEWAAAWRGGGSGSGAGGSGWGLADGGAGGGDGGTRGLPATLSHGSGGVAARVVSVSQVLSEAGPLTSGPASGAWSSSAAQLQAQLLPLPPLDAEPPPSLLTLQPQPQTRPQGIAVPATRGSFSAAPGAADFGPIQPNRDGLRYGGSPAYGFAATRDSPSYSGSLLPAAPAPRPLDRRSPAGPMGLVPAAGPGGGYTVGQGLSCGPVFVHGFPGAGAGAGAGGGAGGGAGVPQRRAAGLQTGGPGLGDAACLGSPPASAAMPRPNPFQLAAQQLAQQQQHQQQQGQQLQQQQQQQQQQQHELHRLPQLQPDPSAGQPEPRALRAYWQQQQQQQAALQMTRSLPGGAEVAAPRLLTSGSGADGWQRSCAPAPGALCTLGLDDDLDPELRACITRD